MDTVTLLYVLFVFSVGLTFGSFVTLASYRLPLGEDIAIKPSRCPKCETKLKFLDLWPVLSWACNKGKCRHCKAPVSARYPLTELVTAAMFVLLYLHYGLNLQSVLLALLWVALMIMIVVDLEHYIIPDQLHYVLLPLGLGYHAAMHTPSEDVSHGFLLASGIGLSLHYGYRYLRHKEGLGFGDVKFFAVAGVWLGLKPIVPFLFFSGIFGIVTGLLWRILKKGPVFPFGPALAVALFLCVTCPLLTNLFWNIGQFIK